MNRRHLLALLGGAAVAPMLPVQKALYLGGVRIVPDPPGPRSFFWGESELGPMTDLVSLPVRGTARLLPMASIGDGFFGTPTRESRLYEEFQKMRMPWDDGIEPITLDELMSVGRERMPEPSE